MTSLFKQTLSLILVTLLCMAEFPAPAESAIHKSDKERLMGHLVPTLASARQIESSVKNTNQFLITLVLRRENQEGFESYLQEVYDSNSSHYHQFLTYLQISDLFGPSRKTYNAVLRYLQKNGMKLVEGSANRLTMSVEATRVQVEQAFSVSIHDYQLGDTEFYANDINPALPKNLAQHVLSISGLTNLGKPERAKVDFSPQGFCNALTLAGAGLDASQFLAIILGLTGPIGWIEIVAILLTELALHYLCETWLDGVYGHKKSPYDHPAGTPDGTGQKVGLLEFDTFFTTDVSNYINFVKDFDTVAPIGNLSSVPVNGGVATPGSGETEVLLDIAVVMRIAPGAHVAVYHAPFTGQASYASLFNAMINDGVTVISNSWASCEDQFTLANVQGIDAVLQTAAASGITVFNATGDSGSTCLNGSANTISVPANSPSATAVGGTSLTLGPGFTYNTETWWDGALATPPTGQGGFGVSKFFTRPSYQNGFNGSAMRSIPDVVFGSDPASNGVLLCQADNGGCPSGFRTGGTSLAAPLWAAMTALLNQNHGQNLGALNPQLYAFGATNAFHNAASMGSDFAHVGLGSPNLNILNRMLSGGSVGSVDLNKSQVTSLMLVQINSIYAQLSNGIPTAVGVPANGTSKNAVLVRLMDANGNTVSGKTVTITPNTGNGVVTPASGVTSVANGSVVFTVTDLTPETIQYTATDVTDGIQLSKKASVTFVTPPPSAAGIGANPTTVLADGSSTSTITVTLKDSLNRPTPGKQILLNQGSSHSIINSANPGATDSNGEAKFLVSNQITENVTYTATDLNDGNLPVPGSAAVSFTNGSGFSCGGTLTPVANAPFKYTDFITGLPSLGFNGGCNGFGMAFDSSGNLYVATYGGLSLPSRLYKFGAAGGTASNASLLASYSNGTCASALSFSKNGQHLYMARQFCGNGGDVVELNTTNGSVVRTVATGINCATGLGTDPISGDLFLTQPCPIGSGSANITRISNPDSVNPTKSTYSSPGFSLGVNFTPDGTLWTESFDFGTNTRFYTKVSPTNSQSPGTFTHYGTDPTNRASSTLPLLNPANPSQPSQLLVNTEVGAIRLLNTTTNPVSQTDVFTGGGYGTFIIGGPDGCAYASQPDRIVRITAADGSCNFAASSPTPSLSISPAAVAPNPLQGSVQTFTATLTNVANPANIPIFFGVVGANSQIKMVPANSNGQASFSYTGQFTGSDIVSASATINNIPLNSNQGLVTWNAGKHVTFLSLNQSSTSGIVGQPVALMASLTDTSSNPAVRFVGQQITFGLQGSLCAATTNGSGIASCSLTPGQAGSAELTASFAGTNQFTGSNDASAFTILPSSINHSPDAVNDNANTTPNTQVIISVLANDTDPDGDTLSVTSVTQPANGTVVRNGNNTVTYTPNNGFTGTNTFNYTISDGHGGSDTATVTVIVSQTQCFKDDSNGNSLKLNLTTGEYFFRTSGGTVYHNFTVLTKVNNVVSFRSVNGDPNLLQGSIQQGTATAWIQVPRKGKTVYKLNDSNISNNGTCP